MNSTLVPQAQVGAARDPAPARVPTDWKTDSMQSRIRRRYAAERRFRLFG
jgi:phosphate transport system permease protein